MNGTRTRHLRLVATIPYHQGDQWMNEQNYTLKNADTRPRLHRRKQNICFVISISAVILKLMIKMTSIFGSSRFLRIAWHETFSLSDPLLASCQLSCNLYIAVLRSRRANKEFKIRRLRTTTTVKHATAHDQNHVTVHFSRVALRLRWVVSRSRDYGKHFARILPSR